MYKIIGVNQSEYGPVSADQVRQWIAEGRVNAQTLAQAEGEANWRPVSSFPEFAAGLTNPAAPPPGVAAAIPDGAERDRALQRVAGPAIGLIIVAALGICASLVFVILNLISFSNPSGLPILNGPAENPQVAQWMQTSAGAAGIIFYLLLTLIWLTVLLGAIKMKNLRSYGFSMAACIIAMILGLCPCCIIGLIIGIWALVVMNKPEVKPYFT